MEVVVSEDVEMGNELEKNVVVDVGEAEIAETEGKDGRKNPADHQISGSPKKMRESES